MPRSRGFIPAILGFALVVLDACTTPGVTHVAALGLTAAEPTALPTAFANGMFIGEHGSWNRTPPVGYKVVDGDGMTVLAHPFSKLRAYKWPAETRTPPHARLHCRQVCARVIRAANAAREL
jgi:hypothetical protein